MTAPILSPTHLHMLRDESGIAEEVIAERGYRSIDGAQGYAELKALGFSQAQARLTPGLSLPIHTTDGQQPLTIYRPDNPQPDANGRLRKYLLPQGASVRLDCPPRCQPLLANPCLPLWLTEGQKKADALASRGAIALCLLGVWNFRGKNILGGTTILADWDYVALDEREVHIVFDNDVMSKPPVRQALDRLTEHLQRKRATVRVVYLPVNNGRKVGVDDYLVAGHTLQDLEALIEAPRLQPQPAPAHVELLDALPASIRRPLTLIDNRAYAAIWPPVKVTRTEILDKHGQVVRLAVPQVTMEQRLFIMRDDGGIFGNGGERTLAELGLAVQLTDMPPAEKLWCPTGIKAYRNGDRPLPCNVFQRIVAVIDRFIDFDRSLADQHTMCELVACYVLATWFLPAFNVIGYLWPNGEKGSGKTQLLVLVAELAYLGQVILAGGTYANLRDLADYGATLCFDDAENVMDVKRCDPDKRTLLLAGNRRGSTIPVKEPMHGREWRTRYVNTFCPRLFSAIQLPDPVLASRAIIVPLIRTADRQRANADPLDTHRWPEPKETLLADLWATALCHLTAMPQYDEQVAEQTTLLGRTLEPWRAIFAVALWLESHGVQGFWQRMTNLATAYQDEWPDLEATDLMPWVIRALCHYATSAACATRGEGFSEETCWIVTTADLKGVVVELMKEAESGLDPEKVSTDRIGRVLSKMRLEKEVRPGGKGARKWQLTLATLRRWLVSYGMPLPKALFPDAPQAMSDGDTVSPSGASGTAESVNKPDKIDMQTSTDDTEEMAEWRG